MKLLRLKITDPAGFRSLPAGFEHHFRTEWSLQDEQVKGDDFAPFVCAGRNGSGKSNLLEALAAIFFQLELQRVQRTFLPEALDELEHLGAPRGFELEYLIYLPLQSRQNAMCFAHVRVLKTPDSSPRMHWLNPEEFGDHAEALGKDGLCAEQHREFLLPEHVLGYSSGENEILSLPFFKTRFVQFDEYWDRLRTQSQYSGRPDARLVYADSGFSQAVLLCNLLFESDETLQPFREDVGIDALQEFRIVLRRSVQLDEAQARGFMAPIERAAFASDTAFQAAQPVVSQDEETGRWRLNVLRLMEEQRPDKAQHSSLALDALRRCATLEYQDEATDTLILDYWVNDATQKAFQQNFEGNPRALFQAFQVLLTLNLYTVSDGLKADLYRSHSEYVSETVPTLASDERVMRFKFVRFRKLGAPGPLMLRNLSDGEHQLLHSLGLCLLFRGTNSLFLLDEPETHFNPDWRANFISRLRESLKDREGVSQEMLITTHSPFLISDSTRDKVLVFNRDPNDGKVQITHPEFNTLGASINKITMSEVFGKRETIGGRAHAVLESFRARFEQGEASDELIDDIHRELGDSVEKILLINAILDHGQQGNGGAQG
ncbi:MAG: restriction system-associated AAA family ATPase [Rhodocyclaceae bacterium]|nr:restriction system-associated AAA family ATPase [Rhodocyclaceae bacterium]